MTTREFNELVNADIRRLIKQGEEKAALRVLEITGKSQAEISNWVRSQKPTPQERYIDATQGPGDYLVDGPEERYDEREEE